MKNLSKFKLSQELRKFMKQAGEEVVASKGKEVTLDHIVGQILLTYLDGKGEIKPLSDYLEKIINSSNYTKEDVKSIVIKLFENLKVSNEFTAPKFIYTGEDSITMNIVADFICRKVENTNKKILNILDEIDTLIFFTCALPETDHSALSSFLVKELGANPTYLTDLYWNLNKFSEKLGIPENKSEENNSANEEDDDDIDDFEDENGELKEKNINYAEESLDQSKRDEDDREFEMAGRGGSNEPENVDPNSRTPFLDKFSTDMTLAAKNNEYDPIVGREKEISQIIEILSCRKKNNGILLGNPGSGKSAIVEGLCQRIVNEKVPRELFGKRVCSLDLNALVAGCQFRGL